jgi:hypothetical protein
MPAMEGLPQPARPPGRSGALPIALWALAAGAVVIGVVWWALAPRGTAGAGDGRDAPGRLLDPLRAAAVPGADEEVAPFSGFAVSVETDPPGAVVSIAGVPRGEAPVLAGLGCAAGDRIEIAAEKAGFPVARTQTTCRRDALVKITVRLRK